MNLKNLVLALGLSVVGLIALGPSDAFARGGGGFHGGGFHGGGAFHAGGGFHAAPAGFHGGGGFHAAPVFRGGGYSGGGYHGVVAPRVSVGVGIGPRRYGPVVGGGYGRSYGQAWVPGYWGWRGGSRLWIEGAYMTPPNAGWMWISPQWTWNGAQWVWQEGYWAPPQY